VSSDRFMFRGGGGHITKSVSIDEFMFRAEGGMLR
jgi:hypothetical protein